MRTARAASFRISRLSRVSRVRASLACAGLACALIAVPSAAPAQSSPPPTASSAAGAQPAKPTGQGIAVLAIGAEPRAKDEAFALARAIYGSRLRPAALDEVRARVLAGGAPPANASRELRELAEIRAGIASEDAAGRRLLTGLAQQVGAEALLVVRVERALTPAGPPPAEDAGVAPGNAAPTSTVTARLFLADPGDFDAARYAPEPGLEGPAAWRSTVISLEARFPTSARAGASAASAAPAGSLSPAPAKLRQEDEKSSPFYTSGWFWGAVGGAALLGAAFYFASRDAGNDPIHVQLKVPK